MYVFTNPTSQKQDVTQGQFLAEFNRFEFWVFLFLAWLPFQS